MQETTITPSSVYELDLVRSVTGPTIRPGGFLLTDRAVEFCGFPKSSAILDAGCGCGATVQHLRERWALSAWGVDLSATLIADGGDLPLIQARADALPFANEMMDGLTCECALSIMSDPEKAIHEYHRVLKPQGYLILSDIYLRNELEHPMDRGIIQNAPVNSCFSGAVSQEKRCRQIEAAGFSILLWEDHTKLLKEMAARFVFEHGSLKKFWEHIIPCNGSGDTATIIKRGKPGYSLLIAQKTERAG